MANRKIGEEFLNIVKGFAEETGQSLTEATGELQAYIHERLAHLRTLVGQAGFDMARQAELDNILMKAGLLAVDEADKADERIIGFIDGALTFAVNLIKPA